ncbi:MAG: hypothetical protein KDD34_08395 [Bdellovibrionales bacterium]|nr:hypothetical protein [Bdellovibrionales bacterium]
MCKVKKIIFILSVFLGILTNVSMASELTVETFRKQTDFEDSDYVLVEKGDKNSDCEAFGHFEIVKDDNTQTLIFVSTPLNQFVIPDIGGVKGSSIEEGSCTYKSKSQLNGKILTSEKEVRCKKTIGGAKVTLEKIRVTFIKEGFTYTKQLFHDGKNVKNSVCQMIKDLGGDEPVFE